jgi:hypothetical protein
MEDVGWRDGQNVNNNPVESMQECNVNVAGTVSFVAH